MKKEIRPQFLKYFVPIVESLKDLGGSGTASEVIDLAIDKLGISEKELIQIAKKKNIELHQAVLKQDSFGLDFNKIKI